ncbi:protein hook homolog isoform X3 [Jatropha curcas]|uniref:protein hook homolog isoform X3 n=1 Tax=Jatropha curcas TaxID=180498 RepID=UPI0005FABF64|nr:protein hook homolog isoform X3 [Jatropha curcas]
MEDDKKKKRNKKKKNKQTKTTAEDDSAVGLDQNGMSNGKNDCDQANLDNVQNGSLGNADVGPDRHQNNGTDISILTEAEKQQWLQREAILKQTIKQLQNENDSHMQKEAIIEEKIKQLQKENDSHRQQTFTLKEKIQLLKNENDSHLQKEAGLETKILQLQDEKRIILQTEASLEEKIKQLESNKVSWTLAENTTKETIARMNIDITKLRMQVVELEESRNSLLIENQQLVENISGLQLQLQSLETDISAKASDELKKHASEREELNSQIEAACVLVDKLITENADLVEKVNELYVKLDRQSSPAGLSSTTGHELMVENAENVIVTNSIAEPGENITAVGLKFETLEVDRAAVVTYDAEPDSGEIVQIPLDDNELRDLEMQAVESDKMEAIPLSDAPLIGAPFRLISFFTSYVSGADLVEKNTLNSRS